MAVEFAARQLLPKAPRWLQWFTGNIGFHHVHHLDARVPNYRLEECHRSVAALSNFATLTLAGAIRAPSYALWDEREGRMVGFAAARRRQPRST